MSVSDFYRILLDSLPWRMRQGHAVHRRLRKNIITLLLNTPDLALTDAEHQLLVGLDSGSSHRFLPLVPRGSSLLMTQVLDYLTNGDDDEDTLPEVMVSLEVLVRAYLQPWVISLVWEVSPESPLVTTLLTVSEVPHRWMAFESWARLGGVHAQAGTLPSSVTFRTHTENDLSAAPLSFLEAGALLATEPLEPAQEETYYRLCQDGTAVRDAHQMAQLLEVA